MNVHVGDKMDILINHFDCLGDSQLHTWAPWEADSQRKVSMPEDYWECSTDQLLEDKGKKHTGQRKKLGVNIGPKETSTNSTGN